MHEVKLPTKLCIWWPWKWLHGKPSWILSDGPSVELEWRDKEQLLGRPLHSQKLKNPFHLGFSWLLPSNHPVMDVHHTTLQQVANIGTVSPRPSCLQWWQWQKEANTRCLPSRPDSNADKKKTGNKHFQNYTQIKKRKFAHSTGIETMITASFPPLWDEQCKLSTHTCPKN